MENKEIKSRLDVTSLKLLQEIEKHLKEEDQASGYSTSMELVKRQGNVFLTNRDPFDLLWFMSFYFNQNATCTCQHGDIALINEDGTHNPDTYKSAKHNKQVWYNACVSKRLSSFSRSF